MVEVMLVGSRRWSPDLLLQSPTGSDVSWGRVVEIAQDRQDHVRWERAGPLGEPFDVDGGRVESV